MIWVLLVLLGVAGEVVKANAWFIVPNLATNVLFGLGITGVIVSGFFKAMMYTTANKKFGSR